MNKILFKIEENYISFSKCNSNVSDNNINNTNVINVKNLKFTEEYMISNLDLISTFVNLIIIKFNIDKVIIKSLEISETVINLLKYLEKIKYLEFTENRELSYSICNLLLLNANLEKISCYSMPNIMFNKFERNKVSTRLEILSISKFLKINNIKTYSDLFNKDKIIISDTLYEDDLRDLTYFLDNNKDFKKIVFDNYNRKILDLVIYFLCKNNLKNINIIIKENSTTTNLILKDLNLFEKYSKKYGIKIRINYSKEYKSKNQIKELNLKILKIIFITVLTICLVLYVGSNINKNNTINHINKINNEIQKIVDRNIVDATETLRFGSPYTDAYSKEYSNIYNELLNLNNDTIGWLTVNNTKINYPIVQSNNNEYYLNHAFDKSFNIVGWTFADYRCDMNNISKNTIIYGHMMSNKLMFSTLRDVLNSNWYNNEENLIIDFSIKGVSYKWKIFSIYTIENTTDYLNVNFTKSEFTKFIHTITNRSINNFNVEVTEDDKILTLSTCFKNSKYRIVLHAVMLS